MQQGEKTDNRIYFQDVPLKRAEQEQKQGGQSKSIVLTEQQLQKINKIQSEYQSFQKIYEVIVQSHDKNQEQVQKMCSAITQYAIYLVKYQKEQIFFQHAVEKKFIALLLRKMEEFKFMSDVVNKVFECIECLLKAISKQDQLVYFLVCVNKEGFLTTKYYFEEDDSALLVNFMKFLTRKIIDDEKLLNIFFNQKQPQFPLLLNLLRFHSQKDQMLRTSVKLTLIQICSSPLKPIQNFISNFPFVMFYPIYVYQIYHAFLQALDDNEAKRQQGRQNLKTSLKFLQDFVQNKDKQAIEMYTNCFMTLIGKVLYKELSQLNKKSEQRVIRRLKVLTDLVMKDMSVLKIKIGLGQFFTKKIGKRFHKFLTSKTPHLDLSYCMISKCHDDIHNHCESIYPNTNPSSSQVKKSPTRSSFLKTFNSYIPNSKDNWLFHELKRLSEMIGFGVELERQINFDEYYSGSYLKAIEKDTSKGEDISNQVYEKLLHYDNEQILFYYIRLITELKVPLKTQGLALKTQDTQSLIQLLMVTSITTSLSVQKSLYQLILQNQVYIDQHKYHKIKELYMNSMQKLIYFVMTEGWGSFINRCRSISFDQEAEFSPDIFRDLQCEILFFVSLRHLIGTKNHQGIRDDKQFLKQDLRRTQIKANCFLMLQTEDNQQIQQPIELILDGQYIKLMDEQQKSIQRESLLINHCHIYDSRENNSLQIAQRQNSEFPSQICYGVAFGERPIKEYVLREIRWREDSANKLEYKFRLMSFEFGQEG